MENSIFRPACCGQVKAGMFFYEDGSLSKKLVDYDVPCVGVVGSVGRLNKDFIIISSQVEELPWDNEYGNHLQVDDPVQLLSQYGSNNSRILKDIETLHKLELQAVDHCRALTILGGKKCGYLPTFYELERVFKKNTDAVRESLEILGCGLPDEVWTSNLDNECYPLVFEVDSLKHGPEEGDELFAVLPFYHVDFAEVYK